MSISCQVDFYQLESARSEPQQLACRLAVMAWERGHRVLILVEDKAQASALDELLWSYPEGRFIPHGCSGAPEAAGAPVIIGQKAPHGFDDVVINLTGTAVDGSARFKRLLEIVPFEPGDREHARDKYKAYRQQGIQPGHHKIN